MKLLHTKGDWNYKIQGFKITIGTEKTGNTTTAHDYTVCEIDDNSTQAENNAKLIAASPILYNAAYSALQAIYAMPKKKQAFYQYLINDLLNAIQKADGTI